MRSVYRIQLYPQIYTFLEKSFSRTSSKTSQFDQFQGGKDMNHMCFIRATRHPQKSGVFFFLYNFPLQLTSVIHFCVNFISDQKF